MGGRSASALMTLLASAATFAATHEARAQQRWIPSGNDRGLPAPSARWLPWSDEDGHPANAVFRSTWLAELTPAEVGFALPAESMRAGQQGAEARYFGKRDGKPEDRRLFGGDGMQLPRESFSEAESKSLREALDALRGETLDRLRATPSSCAWLQNDLLRTARRLLDCRTNPELLEPLLDTARRLALPRASLTDRAMSTFSLEQATQFDPGLDATRLVEVERKSTRLFDAERSLLWSRVFLQWPSDAEPILPELLAAVARGEKPEVPVGARGILVQGIVALDDQGSPCATEIAIDVRIQRFVGTKTAEATASTTRDGIDFRVFWLEREALRRQSGKVTLTDFRALRDEDQALFRDYGTLKHTTLGAQCTLCHRTSGTPEPELAGFPLLRKHAQATVASSPKARAELAERQFGKFLAELQAAAK